MAFTQEIVKHVYSIISAVNKGACDTKVKAMLEELNNACPETVDFDLAIQYMNELVATDRQIN